MKKNTRQQKKTAISQSESPRSESYGMGAGPFKVWVRGQKPGKLLAIGTGITILGYGLYRLIDYLADKVKSNIRRDEHTKETIDDIHFANAKSGNSINEHHQASKDNMAEDDNHTDNDIRRAQALSEIRMEERKQMAEMRQAARESFANDSPKKILNFREWIDRFHAKCPMPDYSSIQFLASVLDGCPSGYEDAAMMSLLSACGALCFSKVRAQYLDGKYHSPSIQVIVEGEHGSGKGKIFHLYECIFSRVIEADKDKLGLKDASDQIIQTAGINISQAKFYEIMANNQEVPVYVMESEISTVLETFKKANGLSFDFLRKAFHNETIYQNNMAKGAVRGSFRVFFDYTFTGTPEAIDKLINVKEVEGGTASRICFAIIPEVGRFAPFMDYPSGSDLDNMQDQIDAWRQEYCFKTVDGKDVACQKYEIDLGYVCVALQDWLDEQYNLSEQDGTDERKKERMRMATIAFHFAIVLHMFAGEPKSSDRKLRKTVLDLTIYIANYCMERYLTKFSDYVPQAPINETGVEETVESTNKSPERRRLTQEEIDEWYCRRGTYDDEGKEIGYGYIAKQLHVTKQSVINSFRSYEKKQGIK